MPLYEYGCRACGARFEEIRKTEQRLNAPPCRECGAQETSLRLSVPGHVGAMSAAAAPSCGAGSGSCCGGACLH